MNVPSWAAWVIAHRRKLYAVSVVAIPLVARYVPGFPTDEVLSVIRVLAIDSLSSL